MAISSSCSPDEWFMAAGDDAIGLYMTAGKLRNHIVDDSIIPMTRTTLERGGNGLEFKWSKGDIVGLFEQTGTQQTLMTMVSGEGTSTARFSAESFHLDSGQMLRAVYPTQVTTDSRIPVSWEGLAQKGNNDWSHLVKNDYMVSDITTPDDDNNASFTLHHVGAIVRIRAFVPEDIAVRSVTLSTDDSVFVSNGILDLFGDNLLVVGERSDKVCVSMSGLKVRAYETITAWLIAAPVNLTGRKLIVTVTSEEGIDYECPIPMCKSPNLEGGGLYAIDESYVQYKNSAEDDWMNLYPDDTNTYNIDGNAYYAFRVMRKQPKVNVNFTRSLKKDVWAAYVIPFDVVITEDMLKDMEFFYGESISKDSVEMDKDDAAGAVVGTKRLKKGDVIKANMPYAIIAKNDGNKTLSATNTVLNVTSPIANTIYGNAYLYVFSGIYETKTWKSGESSWFAIRSDGKFQKAGSGAYLRPFRFYFSIKDNPDNVYHRSVSPTVESVANGNVLYKTSSTDEWKTMTPVDNVYAIDGDGISDFRVTDDMPNVNVSFSRLFTGKVWNPWTVPFDIPVTKDLLEEYDFAYFEGLFANTSNVDKDSIVGKSYGVKHLAIGDTVKANMPYVVKTENDGRKTLSFKNITLRKTVPVPAKISGNAYIHTWTGIYSTRNISSEEYYLTKFGFERRGGKAISVKPFRFYLAITNRQDNPYLVKNSK